MGNAFYDTRIYFRECLGIIEDVSYRGWMQLSYDDKLPVLYLQFFDQIILAWNRIKTEYSDDSECVSYVLQYLMKNVRYIMNDEARYTAEYMYTVAYNCLFSKCRTRKIDHQRNSIEVPEYIQDDLSWFDICADSRSVEGMEEAASIWKLLDDQDADTMTVVMHLINKDRGNHDYQAISLQRKREIMRNLKKLLVDFRPIQ